jgi:flagellar protein FlbD
MIELTQLNGITVVVNCDLIETIDSIPETKVSLTTGKYVLVKENRDEVVDKIVAYRRRILKDLIDVRIREPEKE